MARMFPDSNESRVIFSSRAEEQFYKKCREELNDKWQVYSSCTLSTLEQGQGMKHNEIDFVLYHPDYGILVVEVKGGRIRYEATKGSFFSINRFGQSHQIKNPFRQVLIWKSRFLRYLRRENIKVPCSHAVAFSTVAENEIPKSAEVEPRLIIGINRMAHLQDAIIEIIKGSQPEKYLHFEDVGKQIDNILRGTTFSTQASYTRLPG